MTAAAHRFVETALAYNKHTDTEHTDTDTDHTDTDHTDTDHTDTAEYGRQS